MLPSKPWKKSTANSRRSRPRSVIDAGLFKCTIVPGIFDIREGMYGLALVDINKAGLIDIVATYRSRSRCRPISQPR